MIFVIRSGARSSQNNRICWRGDKSGYAFLPAPFQTEKPIDCRGFSPCRRRRNLGPRHEPGH